MSTCSLDADVQLLGYRLVSWWLSCLDRGALINVDAPGFYYVGGSRPEGEQVGIRFSSWGTKVSSPKGPTSRRVQVTQPRPNQRGHPRIRMNSRCTKDKGQLGRTVPNH